MELSKLLIPFLWVIMMVVGFGMIVDYLLFKKELATRLFLTLIGLMGLIAFEWVCSEPPVSYFRPIVSESITWVKSSSTVWLIDTKPLFHPNGKAILFHPIPYLKNEEEF